MQDLGNYYARLVSWYTNGGRAHNSLRVRANILFGRTGGFKDEYGKYHPSGHRYNIPYWEVLNEVDSEHSMTPEQYTKRYDTIVSAILRVQPNMKFVGLALAGTPLFYT